MFRLSVLSRAEICELVGAKLDACQWVQQYWQYARPTTFNQKEIAGESREQLPVYGSKHLREQKMQHSMRTTQKRTYLWPSRSQVQLKNKTSKIPLGRVPCYTKMRTPTRVIRREGPCIWARDIEAEKGGGVHGNWVCGGRNIVKRQESCRARTAVIWHTHYTLHDSEDNTTNPEGKRQKPHQLIVSFYICGEGKRKEPDRWYTLYIRKEKPIKSVWGLLVDTSVPRGCATVVVGGLKGTPAIVIRLLNFELVSY